MRRREFLASLAGASTLPIGAAAQQRKLPLLAMVHPSNPVEVMSRSPSLNAGNRAFLDELARLGYVEGTNVVIAKCLAVFGVTGGSGQTKIPDPSDLARLLSTHR